MAERTAAAVTKVAPVEVELRHSIGCPAADGRLFGDPADPTNPRKALGIEAYAVTGTGRYNRMSGTFDAPPVAGVVRCIECAQETVVEPAAIPAIQQMLAAMKPQEDRVNA
jgi:hypothetical protein